MGDSIPERIYLQLYDEDGGLIDDNVTWCEDRLNESDIEYFHISKVEQLRGMLRKVKGAIDNYRITDELLEEIEQASKEE